MSKSTMPSWIRCATQEESHRRAVAHASRRSGTMVAGLAAVQAGRLGVVVVLSVAGLRDLLDHMRLAGPPRPTVTGHVSAIESYLADNQQSYILPPVTIGLLTEPAFYSADQGAGAPGWLVVEPQSLFQIIDGQHRLEALWGGGRRQRLGKSRQLMPDGEAVSVFIVVEPNREALDQHFADAARSVPLSPGQLVALDLRDAPNRIVREVMVASDFFRGRIDGNVTRTPIFSQYLFTAAALRGMVVAFVETAAWDELTPERETHAAPYLVESIEILAREMTPWKEIAATPGARVGPQRMAELRTDYVNMHGVGLSLLGRALGAVANDGPEAAHERTAQLAALNWSRSGEVWDDLWGPAGGGITTSRDDLRVAWGVLRGRLK